MNTNNKIAMLRLASNEEKQHGEAIKGALREYLDGLSKIDAAKQNMVIIAEEACGIPGVEKRPFKALAKAMHEAPGSIEERLDAMERFIEMAFKTQGNDGQENIYLTDDEMQL